MRFLGVWLFLCGVFVLVAFKPTGSEARLIVFDVGQGDALLFSQKSSHVLIDSGRSPIIGRKDLFLELTRLGITSLNVFMLTHTDLDHLGGFSGLSEQMPIHEFWINGAFIEKLAPNKLFTQTLRDLSQKPISFRVLNEVSEKLGVGLRIYPIRVDSEKGNDHCLAMEARVHGCTFVFLGDLEAEGEKKFLEMRRKTSLGDRFVILKVAHHGSRTSTTIELLKELRPQVALISVGRENQYGHPRFEVIERLRSFGAQIFRTDFHGAVGLQIQPSGVVDCLTYEGSCGSFSCQP